MSIHNTHEPAVTKVLLTDPLLYQYLRTSPLCLMFVDADFVIRFINDSADDMFVKAQEEFATQLPHFDASQLIGVSIDCFHANNMSMIRKHLLALSSAWTTTLTIGRLIFKITITPLDQADVRVGYVVQWQEQSEEILLIEQIESFIRVIKHRSGAQRMTEDAVNEHYLSQYQQRASIETSDQLVANPFTVKKGLELILDHLKESTLEEIQAERLNTIGFMAAGIAHEINNPISGVLANMMYLKALCIGDEIHEVIDENIDELTRISKIVQGLLGFSRSNNKVVCHPVQLGSAIENVLQLINLQLKSINFLDKERVTIVSNIPTPVRLLMPVISENNFIQILLNLVMNAVHAMYEQHTAHPRVEIQATISPDEHFLEISVTDNGPGIPEPIKNKIFMPFFTTKAQGQGTGMGLALSLNMAKECQGMVYLDESYTEGSRFVLKIPIEMENNYFDLECFSVIKHILENDFSAVIDSFIHLAQKDMTYIHRAFALRDFDLLDQDVRRLMGMSISICAKWVQNSCQQLLDAIPSADEVAIQALVLTLDEHLLATIERLKR
jgi:signal transduction histidine kinase